MTAWLERHRWFSDAVEDLWQARTATALYG
jgi:hypothetical protein